MEQKAGRRAMTFVFLAVLIDTIGFGIIIPVLPQFLMDLTGHNASQATRDAGFLVVTFAIFQFLFGPLIGNLSDRFGRRPILLFSMAMFGANYLLSALAPTLAWLFVGRALSGISGAIYAPANAFIADITPPEERARRFSLMGAAFGVGFVLGPALGGLIGELGPRAPFYAAAIMAGLNFIFGYFVLPETLPKERRRAFDIRRANPLGALFSLGKYKSVIAVIASIFLWFLAFQVYPATWSFFVTLRFDWQPALIGASLAVSGVAMATVQAFFTGRIVKSFGERGAAAIGFTSGIVGMMAYVFVPFGWMIFFIPLLAAWQGVAGPAMNAIISGRVPADQQGELQGGVASANGLGAIIGPLLLTQALAAATSPGAPIHFPGAAFALAAFISLFALGLFLWATRKRPDPAIAEPAPTA